MHWKAQIFKKKNKKKKNSSGFNKGNQRGVQPLASVLTNLGACFSYLPLKGCQLVGFILHTEDRRIDLSSLGIRPWSCLGCFGCCCCTLGNLFFLEWSCLFFFKWKSVRMPIPKSQQRSVGLKGPCVEQPGAAESMGSECVAGAPPPAGFCWFWLSLTSSYAFHITSLAVRHAPVQPLFCIVTLNTAVIARGHFCSGFKAKAWWLGTIYAFFSLKNKLLLQTLSNSSACGVAHQSWWLKAADALCIWCSRWFLQKQKSPQGNYNREKWYFKPLK